MFEHGGNIYKVAKELGCKPRNIIDFSANINPLGVPKKLLKSLRTELKSVINYPDPDYFELKSDLACYCGVKSENITVANGAVALIHSYIHSLLPESALIITPAFSEYENALRNIDCRIDYFQLEHEDDFQLNVDNLLSSFNRGYDLLIICNPNNPTGKFIERDVLERVIKSADRAGTSVLIDESFIEFIKNGSNKTTLSLIEEYNNLFILRSCTKYLAIPGLRVGYGLSGDLKLIKKIKSREVPWQINSLANCAGKFLRRDARYKKRTSLVIDKERSMLQKELSSLEWIRVYSSSVNFILLKLLNKFTAVELQKELLKSKILIRNAENFVSLDKTFVRIAVKDHKSNQMLLEHLKIL